MVRRRVSICALFVLLAACTDDPSGDGDETESGGEPVKAATFVIEVDAAAACAGFGGSVEFMTRRVDCFDPPLPCTVSQDPPWVVGTSEDCSAVGAGMQRFEVTVMQTGRWETRLLTGESACFGLGGEARTNVANADLDANAELVLSPAPAGECE